MVIQDELPFDQVLLLVIGFPINLTAPEPMLSLAPKMMVLLHDAVAKRGGLCGTQLPAKVSLGQPQEQLYRFAPGVSELIVYVFIKDRSAGTKGHTAALIRKQSIRMVMQLGYLQGAVENQPVNHICQLAQTTARSASQKSALGGSANRKAFLIAVFGSWRADQLPERENLTGVDDNAVDLLSREL